VISVSEGEARRRYEAAATAWMPRRAVSRRFFPAPVHDDVVLDVVVPIGDICC